MNYYEMKEMEWLAEQEAKEWFENHPKELETETEEDE